MKAYDSVQAAMGFVLSQTSSIEKEVYKEAYADIQYAQLVPVDNGAHQWAKTVTHFSQDSVGKADWINGNTVDVNLVNTGMQKFEHAIYMGGIGYGFDLEEINHARMMRQSLESDKAGMCRRAYEEFCDDLAFVGNDAKGVQGLINNSAIEVLTATHGDWENQSEDNILEDVNNLIDGVGKSTNYIRMADTLLIDDGRYKLIATRRLSNTTMTILEYIKKNNIYTAKSGKPLTIRVVRRLRDAAANGKARMAAYRRNPQVLKMHIPMPLNFMPAEKKGSINVIVPAIFRVSSLDIRLPNEIKYMDGTQL